MVLALLTLPMQSQDYMNIFFKDGSFRKFYMKNITEISPSKVDAEGVSHSDYICQNITTIYDKYIYNLEDVDSITFTKIDDKIAEQSFVTAMPQVFNIIENCESIKDAESNIDKIKSIEGIANAWCYNHKLYVSISEGETISIRFNHDYILSESNTLNQTIKTRLDSYIKPDGNPIKMVIANQLHRDERLAAWGGYYSTLVQQFKECGIDAYYEPNPNIDFFYKNSDNTNRRNFYDYDIVMLDTHGGYDYIAYNRPDILGPNIAFGMKGHSFVTAEDIGKPQKTLDEDWWEDHYKTFKEWRDKTPYHDLTDIHVNFTFCPEQRNGNLVYVAHPELTEFFFRDISKGKFVNPNSIFFNCACLSLAGNNEINSHSFAKILFGKNLGVYAGYTESARFGCMAGMFLLINMINGSSIEQSIQKLPIYCLKETMENVEAHASDFSEGNLKLMREEGMDNALLEVFSVSGNTPPDFFFFPTTTIKPDNNLINQEFLNNKTVTLGGFGSFSNVATNSWKEDFSGFNPIDVETGVELSYISNFSSSLGYFPSFKKQRISDSSFGNYQFEATIPNLIPEQTYYYRAYTFDGLHYNYGEPCSFIIESHEEPDEPTSDKELMLSESADGVDYKVYKKVLDESDYHVNPDGWKCYRSELSLEITKNGTPQSIVLDNKIYLDDSRSHHGGQHPCILIDHKNDLFIVFCNSKDEGEQYSMDCYSYVSSIKTLDFHKEKVLDRVNMGWYPYFEESPYGLPTVSHFSYAGYYAIQSIRNDDGAWNSLKGERISPEDFSAKSKRAGQLYVIYDDGADNPPIDDDPVSCPAKVNSVSLVNAGYSRSEDYPNRLYFKTSATLNDLTGIEEWGIYFDYGTKVEIPFDGVDKEQSMTLAYSFSGDSRNDDYIKFDINSYVVEWTDAIGVYVKKRDTASGELTTIYGDKYQFKLRYDTPPSMVLSDPVIVGTEVTGTENGYKKYKTTITYQYNLKGAIWVDYVDSAVSGGNWSFENFDETWYPDHDGHGEAKWEATYREDTNSLEHTNWRRLHLRNSEIVNSNYVNFSGSSTITEAWVTSEPVYSRARSNSDASQKFTIREVILPNAAPEVKTVGSYKGGSLGVVAD